MIRVLKIFFLLIVLSWSTLEYTYSQVMVNSETENIPNETPFLDASTYYFHQYAGNDMGKGLVFPATDLTKFVFITGNGGYGTNFPTYFDGMIVYNYGTGNTLTTQVSVSTYVTPGFYYFYNPNGSVDYDIVNGQWVRMSNNLDLIAKTISVSANPPVSPGAGFVYFDTDDNSFYKYDGASWNVVATGGGSTSSGLNLPAQPVSAGELFFETDTKLLWVSDGSAWTEISTGGSTPTGTDLPLTGDAGDTFFETDTKIYYVYDGTAWQALGGVSNTLTAAHVYVGNGSNVATPVTLSGDVSMDQSGSVTIAAGAVDNTELAVNAVTAIKIQDQTITPVKLAGIIGNGTNGQLLTSAGDGTLKWTSQPGSVTGNLYRGTVADLTAFNALDWGAVSSAINVGSAIPSTICNLDGASFTWIAFPKEWGTQNFFYRYGTPALVYAVFDGFEKRIIPAATTGTVDYQVWLFKTKPIITVELIVSNN